MQNERRDKPQFDNLLNFRDVGAHINTILGANVLKTGRLFRSARPDECSLSDREQLINKFKIKTNLDLRSKTEHINAARKRSEVALASQSAVVPSSDKAVQQAIEIPGIRYAYINLNGKGFERHLIWQLKYTSLAKMIGLMALGYRTEGISVLGRELMKPRGLVGLGIDTLDHSGPEIKEVFDLLSDQGAWPILAHCTQGKDRTGLVVLLVLLLCNINIDAISKDYVLSESELEPEKAARMEEISSIGLDESFAGCPPEFCHKVLQHLDSVYGGVEGYLDKIGIDHGQRERVKNAILATQ
ncbi:protein-tyrosine phosphatase [Exophiala viscosa]|uniref:protein-tyrosine phosphatase n=1 Tax=Exophiala viscosa TaxID=2486360 RepID=UPI00218CBDC3|nr:protein-tyrosine phosphatase [Exophiala viscosa]